MLQIGSVFEVAVNDTDLSKRLKIHGKYLLQLTRISVQLMQLDDVNAQGPLFTWPYRCISYCLSVLLCFVPMVHV